MKITIESCHAIRQAPNPKLAEQDWQECRILSELFSDAYFADNFVFTGGGTLTKSYHLSTRQGNDIDLACADFTDIPDNRTKAALNNFRRRFKDYVFDVLKSKINYIINQDKRFMILSDRDWCALREPAKTFSNPSLHLLYKSMVQSDLGHLCIEFMPRRYAPEFIELRSVTPYATGRAMGRIPTLTYAQTFWDKVYALNSMVQTNANTFRETFSRHYYDLANIAEMVDIPGTANLFQNTCAYQAKYTDKNIPALASVTDIQLIPNDDMIHQMGADYNTHIAPRTRTPWAWMEIVHRIGKINARIRELKQYGG